MENEQTTQREQPRQQRLKGIEARLTVLEEQSAKLDRLVYKLFQRVPRHPNEEESPSGEEA